MSLPKNLLYSNKVDSMGARPYTSNIQSQNQNYTMNDTIVLNIPCNRNTVLSPADSYLKFSAQFTNGAAINTWSRLSKAGAHGFFQRIRVFHGSTLLEDVDNVGNLVSQLCTHMRSPDDVFYGGSVTEGFDEQSQVNINGVYNISGLRGQRVSNSAYAAGGGAADIAAAGLSPIRTYCIPLVSILGTLSDKYMPLFAMTSAPIRLELQLVSSASIPYVALTAIASFAVTNVEYIGSFIELSDQALAVIQQSQGGAPLTMAVDRYANLIGNANLLNAVTNVSVPCPMKYSSVQAILATIRQHSAGVTTFDAFGSNHFNLSEYRWQFGSETIPSKAVGADLYNGNRGMMYNYYCSALGSPYSLSYNPLISLYTYDTMAIPLATTETPNTAANNLTSIAGAFGIGAELTSYPSANVDQMFAGRNTSTEDIYLNLQFAANAAAPAVRFDLYCLHHAVIICENGQASIRF
jgi:hypothetical protein